MKSNKINMLASISVFLLVAGLLAGCGGQREEAVKQSDDTAIGSAESVKEVDSPPLMNGAESREGFDDERSNYETSDIFSETTDKADLVNDKAKEEANQAGDTLQGIADEDMANTHELMEETQTAASSAKDDVMNTTRIDESMSDTTQMQQAPAQDATEVVAPTSEIIRGVQQKLADAGFDPGPVDGINGPKTQAALEDFQEQNNLAVGKLTKETLRSLDVNF